MAVAADTEIGLAIESALASDERNQLWLARKTGIAYHNIRRGILGSRRFSAGELAAIRAALPSLPPPETTNGHTPREAREEAQAEGD